MKINIFPVILLVIATAAISYLAYHVAYSNSDTNDIVVGIGTGLSVLHTLGCLIGISLKDARQNVNLKAWAIAAFVIMTATNFCFAGFGVSMPYYIIVIALVIVIHLWVVYKLVLENK